MNTYLHKPPHPSHPETDFAAGRPRRCRWPRRRAFSLPGLLMVLVLLGVFALVASHVFLSATRMTHAAQASQTRTIRFDGMLRQLREDVWTAAEVSSTADTLVIGDPAKEHIAWRIEPGGAIQRLAESPPKRPEARRWENLDTSIKFESRGPAVLVTIRDTVTHQTDQVALSSLLLLSRKETP